MNYKDYGKNTNKKAIGECLVYNFKLDTMEEMLYCGIEVCGDKTYHLVKRRGRGQRPISILVGSRTTSVYVK